MECDLGKIVVHYETFGEGKPIIMLHGWYLDHRSMAADIEPVFKTRSGWKRIYLDLPGMGKTPGMAWIANNDHMLEIVQGFIDKVIPGQRFAVAGYSYGRYLARGIVYRNSSMMNGLLLIAPIIKLDKLGLSTNPILVKDDVLVSELTREESGVFNLAVVQSREALEHFRTYVLPAIRVADREFVKRLQGKFSFNVDALSEPFDKPTLILIGRQDSYVGHHEAWNIIENYPRATFAMLDCSGHFVGRPGEQEKLFAVLINDWIDRIEEYTGK